MIRLLGRLCPPRVRGEGSGEDEPDKEVEVGSMLQPLPTKENPFLNTLVLERLFKLCDSEDLANFRLVSKLWYSESLPRWLSEVPVEIRQSSDPPESITVWKELADHIQAGRKPHRFFRLLNFDNLEFIPIPPSQFNGPNSGEKLAKLVQNVDAFWGSYGPWIEKLELGSCTISGMDSFEKVVFGGTPNLTELYLNSFTSSNPSKSWSFWRLIDLDGRLGEVNLHHLHLQHLRVKLPFSFPLSWRRLLFHFPNLQTLEIDNLVLSTDDEEMNIWRELLMICEERERNRLTMFHVTFKNVLLKFKLPETIHYRLWPPDINLTRHGINRIFRILQPSLKHVIVDLHLEEWREEEMRLITQIIGLCGDAMKELSLTLDEESWYELSPFERDPFCSIVAKLHLKASRNFHLLEKFPNLVELRLEGSCFFVMRIKGILARMRNVKLLKLKKFQCSLVPITEEVLNLFSTMMPKLEYLEVPLTNAMLRVVCRDWPQLRELHIDCDRMVEDVDKIDDEGVTGIIPRASCRLASITDMKNLEVLSIRNARLTGEVSVREGFLKMPHLKSLDVDLVETSDELFDALVKRFPLGKISRIILPEGS